MQIYRIDSNYCQKVSEQVLRKLIYLIKQEEPREQDLLTGLHIIQRIRCKQCRNEVGWKYVNQKELL